MYSFFIVKKTDQKIAGKTPADIVSKMRQKEWEGHSANSDYMHVFAFRNKIIPYIRFRKEDEFLEDLIFFGFVEQVGFLSFLSRFFVQHKSGDTGRLSV